ncbi:diguanylate cyclase domain-containing protein [Thermodesulfobacteriota bacterium]
MQAMVKSYSEKRLVITRYFFAIFMLIGAVLAGTISVLYHLETKDHVLRLKNEERIHLKVQTQIIASRLEDVVTDLKFLSRQNELYHMLESAERNDKVEVAKEYLAFSGLKRKYDQIRFIDNLGMERIRVNFNNGTPVVVSDDHHQEKGNRYYFTETMALNRGDIFVSPMDLNIEQDKIEIPFKPMMRFGIPVFDAQERKRGIIVLNYLGAKLIDAIKESSEASLGDMMLVNLDGFWLAGPIEDNEWGFMFEERKYRKFPTDFPEEWKQIFSSREVQIHTGNGLFTSVTVYPLIESLQSTHGTDDRGGITRATNSNSYLWKIISHIPQQKLHLETRELLLKLFLLGISLFLLSTIPSWIIAQAIVRRKLHQLELYLSANYDKLTELPNRSLLLDRLNQNLKQSKRDERKFALLFIDLDGFKSVNDTLGHDAGDELLIKVAEKLLRCVRESDTVARLGGDEFTVILSTITSSDNAKTVARKIIEILSVPFNIRGHDTQIGASIGISIYPDNGNDIEVLLKKADDAMYLAKKGGKNDYRLSAS